MTDRHDLIADRLEEYLLGQLTPDATRDVEAHLRACASCAAEVRELGDVIELLAQSAPPLTPPAALRERVLSEIAVQSQEPRTVRPAFAGSGPIPHGTAQSGWAMGWLAAAAIVIIGLGVLLFSVDASRRRSASEAQRARAETAALQQRVSEYGAQTDLALSILTAGDMREIPLAGRDNATESAARAYWSPTRGLLLVADRLPVPPPGRIYQVWLIEGGTPVSAGLLGGSTSGRGMLIAAPPRPDAAGAVTVAVTDEPPGGLPAPSGSIRLAGSI